VALLRGSLFARALFGLSFLINSFKATSEVSWEALFEEVSFDACLGFLSNVQTYSAVYYETHTNQNA
jgi:hypothetical protein